MILIGPLSDENQIEQCFQKTPCWYSICRKYFFLPGVVSASDM